MTTSLKQHQKRKNEIKSNQKQKKQNKDEVQQTASKQRFEQLVTKFVSLTAMYQVELASLTLRKLSNTFFIV